MSLTFWFDDENQRVQVVDVHYNYSLQVWVKDGIIIDVGYGLRSNPSWQGRPEFEVVAELEK